MADETTEVQGDLIALTDDTVHYSCAPIQNYRLGEFNFENSTLKLTPEKAAIFDAMVEQLPIYEKSRIAKITVAKAEEIIAAMRQPAATQNNDSAAVKAPLVAAQAATPAVGTKPVDTPKA